jgi:NADH dehydrogenase [ubiquinone] 1 alpha subcomplex assembly factor 3
LYATCPRVASARSYAVDEDGDVNHMRTTVTILNEEHDEGIFVDSYSNLGFRLSNGIRVVGPCAVFPRTILHWNVKDVKDINEESLSLFAMLEPKIDILVLGVGERENMGKVNMDVIKFLRANKINIELLPTDQALSTFNFLNAEKRFVAGAFIPPTYVDVNEDEDIYADVPDSQKPEVAGYIDDDITEMMKQGKEVREAWKEKLRKEKGDDGF